MMNTSRSVLRVMAVLLLLAVCCLSFTSCAKLGELLGDVPFVGDLLQKIPGFGGDDDDDDESSGGIQLPGGYQPEDKVPGNNDPTDEETAPGTSGGLQPSVGLEYTSNGDNTCYVSGPGTCVDRYVVIPEIAPSGETVTAIGNSAFLSCKSIHVVVIPDTVTEIQEKAFSYSSLVAVLFGKNVTTIGAHTFNNCPDLTTVVISAKETVLGYRAFSACDALMALCYTEAPGEQTLIGADTPLQQATVYYYSAEETTGNYWRYVGAIPTPNALK